MQTDVSCLRVRLEDAILKDKWEFSSVISSNTSESGKRTAQTKRSKVRKLCLNEIFDTEAAKRSV